jgi:hypothetical protein
MGLGVGGMLPIIFALVSETIPARHRGWILVLVGGDVADLGLEVVPDPGEGPLGALVAALERFADRYEADWRAGMRAKLGLREADDVTAALIDDLLTLLAEQTIDYTSCFRALAASLRGDAQLDVRELDAAEADAPAPVEDRPATVELDRGGDHDHQRRQSDEKETREDEVDDALDCDLRWTFRRRGRLRPTARRQRGDACHIPLDTTFHESRRSLVAQV